MATEIAPFETDDWGKPDETKLLEYSPDAVYLTRGPAFLPRRWLGPGGGVRRRVDWFNRACRL